MAVGVHKADVSYGFLIAFEILNIVLFVFRFWVLRRRKRNAASFASDVLFAFAALAGLLMTGISLQKLSKELRLREEANLEIEVLLGIFSETWLKVEFSFSVLYLTEVWAMKAAFLTFYWNLFARAQITGWRQYALYGTAIFIPCAYLACLIVMLLHCDPISLNWDTVAIVRDKKFCSPTFAEGPQIVITVLNVVTDLMILTLPLCVLFSLSLSRMEIHAVPFVFLIGLVSIAATFTRFFVLKSLGTYSPNNSLDNVLTQIHWVDVLAHLENLAAQTAFSMPSFRVILTQAFCSRVRERTSTSIEKVRALRAWKKGSADVEAVGLERIRGGARRGGSGEDVLRTGWTEAELEREEREATSRSGKSVDSDGAVMHPVDTSSTSRL